MRSWGKRQVNRRCRYGLLIGIILIAICLLSSCDFSTIDTEKTVNKSGYTTKGKVINNVVEMEESTTVVTETQYSEESTTEELETEEPLVEEPTTEEQTAEDTIEAQISNSQPMILVSEIPAYSGSPYIPIHQNTPYFENSEKVTDPFEYYSDLDSLGRCGVAYANICIELMPTEERESIGMIKPAGWHLEKYDCVDGGYVYNRCHLIGFQLAGENANEKNLITGTRYLNVTGMLPFENQVANYVESTDNHVLYRVTPIYDGNNLLCNGVLMEAESVEDHGEGIRFCVFCYNVQPGIHIDYVTGENWEETTSATETATTEITETTAAETAAADQTTVIKYIGNANTKKFHYSTCSSVNQMKESNKVPLYSREEAISDGYVPCKNCNP